MTAEENTEVVWSRGSTCLLRFIMSVKLETPLLLMCTKVQLHCETKQSLVKNPADSENSICIVTVLTCSHISPQVPFEEDN